MATGSYRQRGCKCPPERKRCTCGAKWYYRYDIIDPTTGKRKQKEVGGFRTKAEAEEAAKRIQYELQQGTYIEEKNITFEEFANKWLDMYRKSGKVKQSTIDTRAYKLPHLMNRFGKIQMKKITKLMYQEFLNDLIATHARKTVCGVHEVASLIFKKALEMEVIATDVTETATVPDKRKTVEDLETHQDIPRYLEKDELRRFLIAAQDSIRPTDYPIFLTLAYTGLRVGELCVLKWKDIDFENQTIRVSKTYYDRRKTIETPKTNSSFRTIDVDRKVLDVLEQHKRNQKVLSITDDTYVFTKNLDEPIATWNVRRWMTELLKAAGLPSDLTPHSLRHTHTSLLAEAGVSLEVIQHRLGHHSDRVTKQIYLHVTKPLKKEASQKFAELMESF